MPPKERRHPERQGLPFGSILKKGEKMFNRIKANKEIDRVFSLAEEAASLLIPIPTFIAEVRFELLFLFFFLMDYRRFHRLDQVLREKILDVFLERISAELSGGEEKDTVRVLYEKRIADYFGMIKTAKKMGDFLKPASEYIEAMALYLMEKQHFSSASADQIDLVWQEITPEKRGTLAEPIAISISMHGQGLL
jgi:hypothetical protein